MLTTTSLALDSTGDYDLETQSEAPAPPSYIPGVSDAAAPRQLKGSGAANRVVTAIFALVIGGAVSLGIGILAPDKSSLAQMFNYRQVESLIPALILSLFFWGMLVCAARRRRFAAVKAVCRPALLHAVMEHIGSGSLGGAILALRGGGLVAVSPLLRRAKAVLEQWNNHPGLQEADVVLQQHIAHDEEETHNAHSLVRLLVWALPVLGLIGTVIGISLAVGGFARFLSGSIEDVAEIKTSLVHVTGGLSFAFLITLEGLATSLVLMFVSSWLQNRESSLLAGVQKQICDELLPAVQRAMPAQTHLQQDDAGQRAQEWQTLLTVAGKGVLDAFGRSAESMLDGFHKTLSTHRKAMESWAGSVSELIGRGTRNLADAAAAIGRFASGSSDQFQGQIGKLHEMLAGQREMFEEILAAHATATTNAHQALITAIARAQEDSAAAFQQQAQTIASHSQAVTQLLTASQAIVDSHLGALAELRATDLSMACHGVSELGAGLTEQSKRLEILSQSYQTLVHGTERLTSSQETLLAATRQLESAGLAPAMMSLSNSLTSLGPVLDGFRRPFVLQAMPVAG